jgi:uncharacterized OB-fold protein
MLNANRPVPVPDESTQGFWEAARRGVLAIQHCPACGNYQHPPQPICLKCHASALEFAPVSGEGIVYSWTVMHERRVAGFEDAAPYTVVVVRLAEQPDLHLVTNWPADAPPPALDQPVSVTFERLDDTISLPQFRPR